MPEYPTHGQGHRALRDGCLSDRVTTWLRRHPDATLTARQISEQFSYKRGSVHERMRSALQAELVQFVGDKRPHVYRLI